MRELYMDVHNQSLTATDYCVWYVTEQKKKGIDIPFFSGSLLPEAVAG